MTHFVDHGIWFGIGFSLLLHLGMVGGYAYLSKDTSGPRIKVDTMTAVLVRKGTPRPKHLLPRIHQQKRAVTPRRRIVAARTPQRQPTLSTADLIRRAEERIRRMRSHRRDEEDDPRADNSPAPGVAHGSEDGTVSDPALARMGNVYGLQLRRKIEQNLSVPPFFTEAQIRQLKEKIQILMFLDQSGRLRDLKISRSSGDSRFDNAVTKAVRGADPYPAPPNQIWRSIKDGIEIGW